MKIGYSFLISSFFLIACSSSPSSTDESSADQKLLLPNGPFFGMRQTDEPRLLFPDLLASSLDEYNGTFSPDGKEFYFTTNTPRNGIVSFTELKEDGKWSSVKIAPFSGEYSEYDPLFSPDGNRLYFSSERPTSADGESGKTNIWYVEKENGQWSDPMLIELTGDGDYYSSITRSGSIYFNVWDNGDIFKASPAADSFEIEKLPEAVNSTKGEGDPFISPDEEYLIFRGYVNTIGAGDLYISFKKGESWSKAKNLGEPINSSSHEMCPLVSPDGKFFIWSSSRILSDYSAPAGEPIETVRQKHRSHDNGQLNIYYMSADFIDDFRAKAVFE